jgi:hypothetical protein
MAARTRPAVPLLHAIEARSSASRQLKKDLESLQSRFEVAK